jgi:hypothetical protein
LDFFFYKDGSGNIFDDKDKEAMTFIEKKVIPKEKFD